MAVVLRLFPGSAKGTGAPSEDKGRHRRRRTERALFPALVGTAIFGLAGLALKPWGIASVPAPLFLAAIGGTLGFLFEVRRTDRIEARTLELETNEWTRLVEEQIEERTSALERVVEGTRDLQRERASTLLGFSHDLRGPLQVVQFGAEIMRMRCATDPHLMGVVADMDQALVRMKRMLADLVETASGERATLPLTPQRLEVADLAERMRRRLRALVHDRDVSTKVLCTREAPDAIEIDPLLLDRVIDNVLTNAAKYTERGTIDVEVHGVSGCLVIQVSDTGCGIDPNALERIFEPGGSSREARRGDSFGVGLSVVIRLLEQVGGRLEVMSKPGEGTCFWVYLPVRADVDDQPSGMRPRSSGGVTRSPVVRIRGLSARPQVGRPRGG